MTRWSPHSRFLDRDDLEGIAPLGEVEGVVCPTAGPAIVLVIRDVEGNPDFGNGVVSGADHSQGIAERVLAAWPALVVHGQLISNVGPVDGSVIEVLDAVSVERELVVGVRGL